MSKDNIVEGLAVWQRIRLLLADRTGRVDAQFIKLLNIRSAFKIRFGVNVQYAFDLSSVLKYSWKEGFLAVSNTSHFLTEELNRCAVVTSRQPFIER